MTRITWLGERIVVISEPRTIENDQSIALEQVAQLGHVTVERGARRIAGERQDSVKLG